MHANELKLTMTDTINQQRQSALTDIFAYLQDVLERYKGSKRICFSGIECDGMLLGFLTIGLNAMNILQPPHPPYNGFSVKDVSERLRDINVPLYCQNRNRSTFGRSCAGIMTPLKAKLDELEQQLQGTELTA